MIWAYLFVALCTYLAYPNKTIWDDFSMREYYTRAIVLSLAWPILLTVSIIGRIIND